MIELLTMPAFWLGFGFGAICTFIAVAMAAMAFLPRWDK